MEKEIITYNAQETKKLGAKLGAKMKKGGIVCLSGDLGMGKTTFAQGFLEELKLTGPYTSPTFLIIKEYDFKRRNEKVYHIDAYRVKEEDILTLGWEEILNDPKNIIIIEWAERIKKIIPAKAIWINFQWLDKNRRKIIIN